MKTALNNSIFRNIPTLALCVCCLLGLAMSQAQAQQTVTLTPISNVISPVNGQHLATVYSTSAGGTWIYSGLGDSHVYVGTGSSIAADGSLVFNFDEYIYWGQPTDTSLWTKQFSGQIVLTTATATGGIEGYLVRTHDHRAGTYVIPNPTRIRIAVEPLAVMVAPAVPGPIGPPPTLFA
jgi:hypothetical protein